MSVSNGLKEIIHKAEMNELASTVKQWRVSLTFATRRSATPEIARVISHKPQIAKTRLLSVPWLY